MQPQTSNLSMRIPAWVGIWSLLGLLFLSGLAVKCFWPDQGLYDVAGYLLGRDFVNVWMASHLLNAHQVATAYDTSTYIAAMRNIFGQQLPFHNWSYPPSLLPFIAPFALLPYGPSLALWSVLGLSVFILTTRPKNFHGTMLVPALLLATAPATLVNLVSGQNGFFTAACFLGGFYLLNRRPVIAGILFGLLTIKPHLGILIPLALILLGQWRVFTVAAMTAIFLVAASIALWGTELWHTYFYQVSVVQYDFWLRRFQGFYVTMMPGPYAAARIMGMPHSIAMITHFAIALIPALASLSIVRREGASARAVLALAIATILITPYAYNYDMTAVTGSLLVYFFSTRLSGYERILFGLLWILPATIYTIMGASLPIGPIFLLAPLLYLTYQSAYPRRDAITIVPYTPARAPYFDQFNREWIARFFWIEPFDNELLTRPQDIIIAPGGEIWFAEENGVVLGTCALLKSEKGVFEFSKLGVAKEARGRGISHTLLHHCIKRARLRGAHTLRIFTSSSLTTACALYRAEGFRDVEIPAEEKSRYQRADTLLTLRL